MAVHRGHPAVLGKPLPLGPHGSSLAWRRHTAGRSALSGRLARVRRRSRERWRPIMMPALIIAATLVLQASPFPPLPLTATAARPLGTLRQQAALQQEWLRYRVRLVLARPMAAERLELW